MKSLQRVVERHPVVRLAAVFAVFFFAMALYAGTLGHPLIWDDVYFVEGQTFLSDCSNLWEVLHPKHLFYVLLERNSARPAWLASVLMDQCLFGGHPAGYRLTSLLLHGAGAVVFMVFARQLTGLNSVALLCGVLFAAYPLHAESINIITFRSDLLAFLFLMVALASYIEHRRSGARSSWRWLLVSAASFSLAMFSKEMAVTFPLLVLWTDHVFPAQGVSDPAERRRRFAFLAGCVTVLVFFGWFWLARTQYLGGKSGDFLARWRAHPIAGRSVGGPSANFLPGISSVLPATPPAPSVPPEGDRVQFGYSRDFVVSAPGGYLWLPVESSRYAHRVPSGGMDEGAGLRLRLMSRILSTYLVKLIWPWRLQGDYHPLPAPGWFSARLLGAWAVLIGVFLVGWRLRRRWPAVSFGIGWIFITLLPVSGVLPLLNYEADRYLYVPSAGACLILAAILSEASRRRAVIAAILGTIVVAAWSARTVIRNRDFRSIEAFHRATLDVDPRVPRSRFAMAHFYRSRGETRRAEAEYRAGLKAWPKAVRIRGELARSYVESGRIAEGITELGAALRDAPEDPSLHYNLGMAFWRWGRLDEALRQFDRAIQLRPASYHATLAAGAVRLNLGRRREAVSLLEAAMSKAGPADREVMLALGEAYGRAGLVSGRERLRRILLEAGTGL